MKFSMNCEILVRTIDSLAPARSVAPQPSAPPNSSCRFPSRSNLPRLRLRPASARQAGPLPREKKALSDFERCTGHWPAAEAVENIQSGRMSAATQIMEVGATVQFEQ
jgi:hypothetical protein